MKFLVVLSCLFAVALARPGYLFGYDAIIPGAPLGPDGRVVDEPIVALAKAEHAAAHLNERLNLNKEALRSADYLFPAAAPIAYAAPAKILATDPRPLDTPEVALAKAAHYTAHAYETARNLGFAY